MSELQKFCFESRLLEDGRGGLFVDGELMQTFPTEAESDAAGLLALRMMVVGGLVKISGQALRDEKPFDLFEDFKDAPNA
jgi:hypothetical protein